jgi:hypothetical protein
MFCICIAVAVDAGLLKTAAAGQISGDSGGGRGESTGTVNRIIE